METSARDPKTTAKALGGIIMAREPLMHAPMEMVLWYPLFCISGRSKDPNMAAVPILEPLSVEKIVAPPTLRRHNLPGMRPIHLSRVSMALIKAPEWNRSSPINMKSGTGRRTKVLMEEKIEWPS